MITKMNHVSVYVLDQDSAHDFYVNKLGFSLHTDASMGLECAGSPFVRPNSRICKLHLWPSAKA